MTVDARRAATCAHGRPLGREWHSVARGLSCRICEALTVGSPVHAEGPPHPRTGVRAAMCLAPWGDWVLRSFFFVGLADHKFVTCTECLAALAKESHMETQQQATPEANKASPEPRPATPKSLVTKLAEVMGEVERIPKSGRNQFHNYDYATEADIVAAVRKGLAARHIVLVPEPKEISWRDATTRSGPTRICTLRMEMSFMDGDTGEVLSFHAIGEGQDSGDKAIYKAKTGAVKYALLKFFLIPTGDDPENDSADHAPQQNTQGRGRPAQKQQASRPAKGEAPAGELRVERDPAASGVPELFDQLFNAIEQAEQATDREALTAAAKAVLDNEAKGSLSAEQAKQLRARGALAKNKVNQARPPASAA